MKRSLLVFCSFFALSIFASAVAQADPHFDLYRTPPNNGAIRGRLTVRGGRYSCDTMERDGINDRGIPYLIAPGTYDVELVDSFSFGYTPEIMHVPNRSYLYIHAGNYPTDSTGCILPGRGGGPGYINSSQDEVDAIIDLIERDPNVSRITIH
ncbi:hypothetical protein AGMMS50222_08600 [Endomicrobiia bacterium]|nr:hypothetical protein AGMMS49556_08290 [Endomicrobiia bacterium]GHT76276.1 hypothetical protein AGMMS50222_08600 [Endomicrobiia bacterium]